MVATLLVAAHGTRSPAGSATTARLLAAVATARPDAPVHLCFLDVAEPSLAQALDDLPGRDVVVVPLLLSAGYHVRVDIPAAVAPYPRVTVARHLGPDPLVIGAIAARLAEAHGSGPTFLAAIASSQSSARDEVDSAAASLSAHLGHEVGVLPLGPSLPDLPDDAQVGVYLLAEGGFLDALRRSVPAPGVVAEPIGAHPALVELVWSRYDEAARTVG